MYSNKFEDIKCNYYLLDIKLLKENKVEKKMR